MEKWNEFMEKVKADEVLQKEFAEIIGEGGKELTKEQKEKIAELVEKSGIELNLEGELSEEELEKVAGGISDRELLELFNSAHWYCNCPLCSEYFTYSWNHISGKLIDESDMIERDVYNDIYDHLIKNILKCV